jgi:hypothetical protein
MVKEVSPRRYFLIVATIFVAMVVVTLVIFLAVERAAHHLPGARPDLSTSRTHAADAVTAGAPGEPPQQKGNDPSRSRDPNP